MEKLCHLFVLFRIPADIYGAEKNLEPVRKETASYSLFKQYIYFIYFHSDEIYQLNGAVCFLPRILNAAIVVSEHITPPLSLSIATASTLAGEQNHKWCNSEKD